jgi:hypothetical protein
VNGEENNPTFTVVRGHTYKIVSDVPELHRVWIKTALGTGSTNAYIDGINDNGSEEIYWRVASNAPVRLVYQSWSDPQICGSIAVADTLPVIPSEISTVGDLKEALDILERYVITRPEDISGIGTKIDQGKLVLADAFPNYLKDGSGNIYSTQTNFAVNDNLSNLNTPPTTLAEWLNYIAALIKQVKGSAGFSSSVESLISLQTRIDDVNTRITTLEGLV